MNRCLTAEISRLGVENLGNSTLLPALFALIRNISSRHPSGPELIRGSLRNIAAKTIADKLICSFLNTAGGGGFQNLPAFRLPWLFEPALL